MKIDRFDGPNRFLSNFYPSPITVSGIVYPTVEHAFQAAKTTDPVLRRHIAMLSTPGEAKRAGRRLELREGWDGLRIDAMRWLLAMKFAPGSTLASWLIATDPAELIEGNDWGDTFWGMVGERGENHLGRLLMQHRAVLRMGMWTP
jgi:N-glycosidase YbiA